MVQETIGILREHLPFKKLRLHQDAKILGSLRYTPTEVSHFPVTVNQPGVRDWKVAGLTGKPFRIRPPMIEKRDQRDFAKNVVS